MSGKIWVPRHERVKLDRRTNKQKLIDRLVADDLITTEEARVLGVITPKIREYPVVEANRVVVVERCDKANTYNGKCPNFGQHKGIDRCQNYGNINLNEPIPGWCPLQAEPDWSNYRTRRQNGDTTDNRTILSNSAGDMAEEQETQ